MNGEAGSKKPAQILVCPLNSVLALSPLSHSPLTQTGSGKGSFLPPAETEGPGPPSSTQPCPSGTKVAASRKISAGRWEGRREWGGSRLSDAPPQLPAPFSPGPQVSLPHYAKLLALVAIQLHAPTRLAPLQASASTKPSGGAAITTWELKWLGGLKTQGKPVDKWGPQSARRGERSGEAAFAESISVFFQAPGRSRLGSCPHFLIFQM